MGQQPSTPKITAQDRAIFQLKQQRDKIKQHQRKLNVLVVKQTTLAKKAISNNQSERAKFYLKSKKQQESLINRTFDQLDNLEKLIGTIEFKLIEKDVIYGLKQGNEILNKLNNEMKVEKIDKILDELEENKVKVDEISESLGMGGSNLNKVEEDEVDQEFEKLNREINGTTKLPQAPTDKIMPNIPTTELPKEKQDHHENEPIAI